MRIAGASLLIGGVIWIYAAQAGIVYPTPDTESAFLKAYSPNSTIEQYKDARVAAMTNGRTAAADKGFASYEENFEPIVVIRNEEWVALIQDLRKDVALQLAAQKAAIFEESGSVDSGFKVRYAIGHSEGTVTIDPLQTLDGSQLGTGRTAETATVRLRIRIQEKWFRAKRNAASRS
jgi:hypothetical protein